MTGLSQSAKFRFPDHEMERPDLPDHEMETPVPRLRVWQIAPRQPFQSNIAIPLSLTLLDTQHHALTVEPRLGSGGGFVVDDQLEKSPTSTDRREPTRDRRAESRALIDRVTVESTMIRIALSVHAAEGGEADTLSLPWTESSPHRRREIIQGANEEVGVARGDDHVA